jgi:hypothetical protein
MNPFSVLRTVLKPLLIPAVGAAILTTSAHARQSRPVPLAVEHKIAALFGPVAIVPSWLPPGFIYIEWKAQPPSGPAGSTPYGQFEITFAHRGKVLLWRVYDPGNAIDCTGPFQSGPSLQRLPDGRVSYQRKTVRGRRLLYENGNHGQSGVWCFGKSGNHGELSTWDDHLFSPATELRMVATARLAR